MANATEPSVCGGDAALCQITLTTCLNAGSEMPLLYSAARGECTHLILFPFQSETRLWRCTCVDR